MNKYHPSLPLGITTINPGVMLAGTGLGENGRPIITNNPGIIPDVCTMELDIKFLPNETKAGVRKEFEEFVHHFSQQHRWLRENPPTVTWEVGGLHFSPVDTPVDHPLVRSLLENRRKLHLPAETSGFIAVCDAAHYSAKGTDSIIFGPSGDGFHGLDEYVTIESLIDTTAVVAASVVEWCGCKGHG
jgi:acetylornithine deacetylase